jgi:hypothetical protein
MITLRPGTCQVLTYRYEVLAMLKALRIRASLQTAKLNRSDLWSCEYTLMSRRLVCANEQRSNDQCGRWLASHMLLSYRKTWSRQFDQRQQYERDLHVSSHVLYRINLVNIYSDLDSGLGSKKDQLVFRNGHPQVDALVSA